MANAWKYAVALLGVFALLFLAYFGIQKVHLEEDGQPNPGIQVKSGSTSPNSTSAAVNNDPVELVQSPSRVEVSSGYSSYDDFKPFVVYEQNLDAAEKGDARSQYVVAKMLQTCAGSIRSRDRLKEIRDQGKLSEETILGMEKDYERCREFHKEFQDIKSVRDTWYESAASKGLAVAQLHQHVYGVRDPLTKEEFQQLLLPALENAGDDPFIMEDALFYVNVFFSEHAEWRYVERAAWNIVYCRASPRCDESSLVTDQLALVHKPAELESIEQLASSYTKAINERRWADLDLTHP